MRAASGWTRNKLATPHREPPPKDEPIICVQNRGWSCFNAWTESRMLVCRRQFSVSKRRAVEEGPESWPSLQRTPRRTHRQSSSRSDKGADSTVTHLGGHSGPVALLFPSLSDGCHRHALTYDFLTIDFLLSHLRGIPDLHDGNHWGPGPLHAQTVELLYEKGGVFGNARRVTIGHADEKGTIPPDTGVVRPSDQVYSAVRPSGNWTFDPDDK